MIIRTLKSEGRGGGSCPIKPDHLVRGEGGCSELSRVTIALLAFTNPVKCRHGIWFAPYDPRVPTVLRSN